MSWTRGALVSFDLETTGTDIEHDRIVSAALVCLEADGRCSWSRSWLLDPGVAIPEGASSLHGISTERARGGGLPARDGVERVTATLAGAVRAEAPLVVMNARFDLSLLDRECRRHGVPTLGDRLGDGPPAVRGPEAGGPGPARALLVLDPLVLDRHVDRDREGRRHLRALCAHYGVRPGRAHHAGADALAAARVVRCIAERHPEVALRTLDDLYDLQVLAAADHADSLRERLRRRGRPGARIDTEWPLVPYR